MDYFQTSERYRKQEMRKLFSTIVRLSVMALCIWIGWFWGFNQRAALTASSNDQIIRLTQQNERLEQRLATLSSELQAEKQKRVESELLLKTTYGNSAQKRLNRQVARYLAKGIDEDQISLALKSLSSPLRCRPIETTDIAVATSFFAGRESMAELIGGGIRVFMEGQAGREATRDKPWFDPSSPVSVRIAYLNGEKIHTGTLPFETSIIADTWLVRIKVTEAGLQGYATLMLDKCSLK